MPPRIPYARIATAWLLAAMLGACAGTVAREPDIDASVAVAATTTDAANDATDAVPANAPGNPLIVGGSVGRSVVSTATESDASSTTPTDAGTGNARADADATATPTQAEDDFAAIYGGDADATAPGARNPMDPWEPFNRR